MIELVGERRENSKIFKVGGALLQQRLAIGAIHYKDNYADPNAPWKDIDLTWVGNRITKAPYEITYDAGKYTIRDKKSGDVSSVELLDSTHTDFEVVPNYTKIKFRHSANEGEYFKARFKFEGKHFHLKAYDDDGELELITTIKDGVLTEELNEVRDKATKQLREAVGKIKIDPTWQVGASTDDVSGRLHNGPPPNLFDLTWVVNRAGGSNTRWKHFSGMRFLSVVVPNAATIISAKVTFISYAGDNGADHYSRFSADDVDDATTFDDWADYDARWQAKTTAVVDFDQPPTWTAESEYDSPDIATVIKEIVDRVGWAPGQDMAILWEDLDDRSAHNVGNYRTGYSWDASSTKAPVLTILYKPLDVADGDLIGIPVIRKS